MLAGRTSGGHLVHHPAQSKTNPMTTSGQLWPYLSLENNQEWRFSGLFGEHVSVLHYSGGKVFSNVQSKPQKYQFLVIALFILLLTTVSVTFLTSELENSSSCTLLSYCSLAPLCQTK